MNVTAITAEFNPFHNGHAFLIDHARRILHADHVVILMSGNFVQRGEPAVYDKFLRTEMALRLGADLVLELPSAFATASAREFAGCAVSMAEKTGIVDTLLFGTEPDTDPKLLSFLAALLISCEHKGPSSLKQFYARELQLSLKNGQSFPKAREEALRFVLRKYPKTEWKAFLQTIGSETKSRPAFFQPNLWPVSLEDADPLSFSSFSSPNSILALEYLQALFLRHSSIRPVMAPRQGDGYHTERLSESPFASATALRRALLSGAGLSEVAPYIPKELHPLYQNTLPIGPSALDMPLSYCLLSLERSGTELCSFSDVSPELAGRLQKSTHRICSFSERVEELWTKQYTRSRVSRALLHILLGITKESVNRLKEKDYVPFLRVLGFSERAKRELLPALKKNAAVPILTRPAAAKELLSEEIRISDLYYGLQADAGRCSLPIRTDKDFGEITPMASRKNPVRIKNECERQLVIL